jgi:lipoprotein signal peptidase
MPSQNEENNLQLMGATNNPSAMSGNYADGISDDVTDDRFELSAFEHYFPNFNFADEYLPLGTSKPYCLHFDWIEKRRANIFDMYSSV